MADIDHFKSINDRYGHQAGDTVLKEISGIFIRGLRKSDPVGRYGGEEFGIVMGSCELEKAVGLCERLRTNVMEYTFIHAGQTLPVTLSMGVACYLPASQKITDADLIHQADEALYRAKANGRNRLVIAETP